MAARSYKKPIWLRQPNGLLRIVEEWRSSVVFASLGSLRNLDIVSRHYAAQNSTVTLSDSPVGLATTPGTSNSGFLWSALQPIPSTGGTGYTILTLANPSATASVHRHVTIGTAAASAFTNVQFGFNFNTSGSGSANLFTCLEYSSGFNARASYAGLDGAWHVYIASRATGTVTPTMYVDGVDGTFSGFTGAGISPAASVYIQQPPSTASGQGSPASDAVTIIFGHALSPQQVAKIGSDPDAIWQIFEEDRRRVTVGPATAGGESISVPSTTLQLTSVAPQISATGVDISVSVPSSALTLSSVAPLLVVAQNVQVPASTLTLAAVAPSVSTEQTIAVPAASLVISAVAPLVSSDFGGISVSVPPATLSLSSSAPSLSVAQQISVGASTLTIDSAAPQVTVAESGSFVVPAASLTLSGAAPLLTVAQQISVPAGTLTLQSSAPTVTNSQNIAIGGADLTLSGVAPTVLSTLTFIIDPAQIIITGAAPTVSGGVASVVPSVEQPAGRPSRARKPSKRKRRPVLVTIDGEDFVVSSEYEAEELLAKATEAAEEQAKTQASTILKKRTEKAKRGSQLNTSPLRLEEPTISVAAANDGAVDQKWVDTIRARFDAELSAAYAKVKQDAEITLLMGAEMAALDDEDALVALLLTI